MMIHQCIKINLKEYLLSAHQIERHMRVCTYRHAKYEYVRKGNKKEEERNEKMDGNLA